VNFFYYGEFKEDMLWGDGVVKEEGKLLRV
jgi:hypothetical protein